jgi:hypothetical protein
MSEKYRRPLSPVAQRDGALLIRNAYLSYFPITSENTWILANGVHCKYDVSATYYIKSSQKSSEPNL